jgi:broad specificity phosphatase PhoE
VSREVVLVRHGETEWSRSGQHTGTTDLPLLPEGEAQAREVAPRLAEREFALVLCSPMQRARRTAELAGFGDRAEPDGDLKERDYGVYEGRTTKEIRVERPGWDVWRDDCPGGETLEQLAARADRVIERALAADGDTIVFAHGHLLRILAARWLGQPAAFGGQLLLSTGSMSELGFERERRAIALWNDTSHHM